MGHGLLRWSLKPNITSIARLLAYVTGLVNQELLLKNEYLLAENRILKAHLQAGFRLSRPERTALAEIGKRLGRKLLQQVASVANPDTILGWYRKLVAAKFDGSPQRRLPGRPRIAAEIERLVVRLARENSGSGYDRIVGALANLGHTVSDRTVGNILRRHGIAPAPERKRTTTWSQFIRSHMAVLAGTDFFTVEVLTWRGLVTYYVLFFLHLETRRVTIMNDLLSAAQCCQTTRTVSECSKLPCGSAAKRLSTSPFIRANVVSEGLAAPNGKQYSFFFRKYPNSLKTHSRKTG